MNKSDKFNCCKLETLFKWIWEDKKKGEIFNIPEQLFFISQNHDKFKIQRYGKILETPIGVAAGPHTQLSQNIISAWLVGARYIELKTVQVLDELEVTKPCIDMTDEGYNCEWSQELKLEQSFNEYLNAWIMIHILKDDFKSDMKQPGFIFNMSVGYNLEGIMSLGVQKFLDKMNNCTKEKNEKINRLAKIYPRIKQIDIPNQISDNLTISTMHGCPPDEIENIGLYFITQRKLHTTIKLNPTLLGSEQLRDILNNRLGFETKVPDLAFDHDLKYDDGVKMIKKLIKSAKENQVDFNLKLTNTLETANIDQNLPKNEDMVYMSGRVLHPISINLANKLQKEFDGTLDISFSAGADCFNIIDILKCNLKPVTVCSDILKPGGYGRIAQYLQNIKDNFSDNTINDYILKTAGKENLKKAIVHNLGKYSTQVVENKQYKKEQFPYDSIKTKRELPFFDCAKAPCMETCPVNQNIPEYLNYVANKETDKAFQTILADNPFPNVQGKVCDQMCQTKCTRINYDNPLMIREIKRYIADNAKEIILKPGLANNIKVAIIGAGPSGLSAAYFLALNGFEVEIMEANQVGGMARYAIPDFRLDQASLNKDIERIKSLGVKIHINKKISKQSFADLKKLYDYIYIAVGAQDSIRLNISDIDNSCVFDHLEFLNKVKKNKKIALGNKVIVIGGGNSAMDAARSAKRLIKDKGEVTILYRRTRKQMPAAIEEIQSAMQEGVKLIELASPEAVIVEHEKVAGILATRMKLGEPDKSGRKRPVKIEGSEFKIQASSIIQAVGQKLRFDFDITKQVDNENVFMGGDALRGPSTLINAIADGKNAANQIMEKAGIVPCLNLFCADQRKYDLKTLKIKQTRRIPKIKLKELAPEHRMNFDLFVKTLDQKEAQKEAARCLQCDLICNICVSVCPNRSNICYEIDKAKIPVEVADKENGKTVISKNGYININQPLQVINIGDFCNECGNCETFCPTNGAPYKDKPKFHITKKSFTQAEFGFYFDKNKKMQIKNSDGLGVLSENIEHIIYENQEIKVTFAKDSLHAIDVIFKNQKLCRFDLLPVAQYAYLYKIMKKEPLSLTDY